MTKPLLGIVVGAGLGALDGMSAWFSADARPIIVMIITGSSSRA